MRLPSRSRPGMPQTQYLHPEEERNAYHTEAHLLTIRNSNLQIEVNKLKSKVDEDQKTLARQRDEVSIKNQKAQKYRNLCDRLRSRVSILKMDLAIDRGVAEVIQNTNLIWSSRYGPKSVQTAPSAFIPQLHHQLLRNLRLPMTRNCDET